TRDTAVNAPAPAARRRNLRRGSFMALPPGNGGHAGSRSALMLAALVIGHHLSISALWKAGPELLTLSKPAPVNRGGSPYAHVEPYFTRFHATGAAGPPPEGVGWTYFNSSPVIARLIRF